MIDEDVYQTEKSLIRTNKVCKFICVLMKVVFVLMCIWWLAATVLMGFSVVDPKLLGNIYPVNILTLISFTLSWLVMAVVCITLIAIFSDASKGHSPFTMLQVKRLRLVAGMLLLYAALEFAITYSASLAPQGWMGSSGSGASTTVDIFTIIAAAVIFAFSFVFKYGILLQKLSDETI